MQLICIMQLIDDCTLKWQIFEVLSSGIVTLNEDAVITGRKWEKKYFPFFKVFCLVMNGVISRDEKITMCYLVNQTILDNAEFFLTAPFTFNVGHEIEIMIMGCDVTYELCNCEQEVLLSSQ